MKKRIFFFFLEAKFLHIASHHYFTKMFSLVSHTHTQTYKEQFLHLVGIYLLAKSEEGRRD